MNQLTRVETEFSPDRVYRYTLWREWEADLLSPNAYGFVQFIGLNPSTADEQINDPTVRRCIDYAKRWGYGAMCMTNLFAFRSTDPRKMMAAPEIITGTENYARENALRIAAVASQAALIICAWGNRGAFKERAKKILTHLRGEMKLQLHHLGLNDSGQPKHPLYLRSELKPIPFTE